MKYYQAAFMAKAINALFEKGQPYIVVNCHEDRGYRPEIEINKFNKASVHEAATSLEDGYLYWDDDSGIWSSLYEVEASIDADHFQVIIRGKLGSGAWIWRCLRSAENKRWEDWRQWQGAWWKLEA